MKCVILCGGKGTRLREETEYRPKPLIQIGPYPLLIHIMNHYMRYGIDEFVLCLGYKSQMIKEYFLNFQAMAQDLTVHFNGSPEITYHGQSPFSDFKVTLIDTGLEAMTGARIMRARAYIGEGDFFLTYGDGLSDVNIEKLQDYHAEHDKLVTVTTVHPVSRFGNVNIAQSGRVSNFYEKPKLNEWISAGFFVCGTKLFDYLSDHDDCVFEQRPLERIASDGELMAYRHEGFFMPIDTHRDYLEANRMWSSNQAQWKE